PISRPPSAFEHAAEHRLQGGELVRRYEPVSDTCLECVVEPDDVDGQVETVHEVEVAEEVALAETREVLVPARPDRWYFAQRRCAHAVHIPVGESCQGAVKAA